MASHFVSPTVGSGALRLKLASRQRAALFFSPRGFHSKNDLPRALARLLQQQTKPTIFRALARARKKVLLTQSIDGLLK